MSSSFTRMFYGPGGDRDDEEIEREAPSLPPWIGPPDDELGAVVRVLPAHRPRAAGRNRVSNLGVRRGRPGGWAGLDAEPSGPVFFEHGGGGSSGGGGRVSTSPSFWLWPLPESGRIQVFCEWPIPEIPLASVELDVAPLAAAKERVVPLWPSA